MDAERVLALAERVAAGSGVDWRAEAESSGDNQEREIVRSMGVLARIADLHAHGTAPASLATIDVPRPSTPADELPTSRRWGPLEQLEYIGKGGFGIVCKAWDPKLQIWVALKLARRDTERSEQTEQMLEEARLMARVRHENVVRIYGTDVHDGRAGIWMELIDGRTLDEIVKFEGRMDEKQVIAVGKTLSLALAAIHKKGIIHKDIKAHNVMRETGGRLLLMDFGASSRLDDVADEFDDNPIRGTPYYLAPELLDDFAPSVQSDVYSLGVLLFYLLTARYPIEADSFADLVDAHRAGRVQALVDVRPKLSPSLHRVVTRATHAEPAQRYESAGRMAHAFEVRPPHFVRWIVVAVLVITLGSVGAIQFDRERTSFVVGASLYRAGATPLELHSGARVEPGDQLYLELEATKSLYVYVLNQDEKGVTALLFPIPGLAPQNPIDADQTHHLPGALDSQRVHWVVTSRGERERFWIVGSRKPVSELDELIEEIAPADFDRPRSYPTVGGRTLTRLRGITGLAPVPETSPAPEDQNDFFSRITELASEKEKQRGIWVRRIELENP